MMALNAATAADAAYSAVKAIGNGTTETDAKARIEAMIEAIFDHIAANATIASLTVTETPIIGTSVHVHDPIQTTEATGKIS